MKKTVLMLVGAVVFGLVAAFLSVLYIKAREAAHLASLRKEQESMVEVVVSTSNLPKGTAINAGNFALRTIPADYVHPEAITIANFDALEGRILVEPLAQGKPLLASFVEPSIPVDFSDTVKVGRRAMTVQVDELNSIAGMARPGNRVDIYVLTEVKLFDPNAPKAEGDAEAASPSNQGVSYTPEAAQRSAAAAIAGQDSTAPIVSDKERPYVIPVLQNLEVLATDQVTDAEFLEMLRLGPTAPRRERYTTITVNVSPKEAALLSLAQEKGELLSLLRNRTDDGGAEFAAIGEDDLFLNSFRMVAESIAREAERSLDGLIVTADGKIMTKDGRIIDDPNLVVKDGVIMTKDGVVLSGRGLVITKDGKIMTKDGRLIDPSKVRMTEDGRLITEDGEVIGGTVGVTKDGRIIGADGKAINPNDLVVRNGVLMTKDGRIVSDENLIVGADGTLRTRDGRVIGSASVEGAEVPASAPRGQVTMTADGRVLDADGNEINPNDLIIRDGVVMTKDGRIVSGGGFTVTPDGKIVSADGRVVADRGGVTVTADGRVLDANGNEINPNDLVVRDGVIMTKDGRIVSGSGLRVTSDGKIVTADGTVVADKSVTVTADGRIIGADGKEIDPKDLIVKDGVLMTKDGVVVSGSNFVVTEDGKIITADGKEIGGVPVLTTTPRDDAAARVRTVDFIVGGTSKDGVAEVKPVPVAE